MVFLRFFTTIFCIVAFQLYGFTPKACVLFNQNGDPSKALLDVLNYYELVYEKNWESIVKVTQKMWLRKQGKERWDLQSEKPKEPFHEYRLFAALNLLQDNLPVWNHYDYVLILGATTQSIRNRLFFLKKMWEQGVRFQTLVLLGSSRPLDEDVEDLDTLISPEKSLYPFRQDWIFDSNLPQTEIEMMRFVLDQLDLPKEWNNLTLVVVDTPLKPNGKRPTTADTFYYWLEAIRPIPGSILAVSSQPFVGRQDSVARQILPCQFPIDSIGKGVSFERFSSSDQAISVILNDLARWIYTVSNCGF